MDGDISDRATAQKITDTAIAHFGRKFVSKRRGGLPYIRLLTQKEKGSGSPMGINLADLNDKQKSLIADRPRTKAWQTFAEAENKRQQRCELEMHAQFWSFLRRHQFEDVEYSNPHRSTRARKDRPDFLICRDGRRLGIEFKVPGNKLSPEQETFLQMAQRQGNLCLVCFSYGRPSMP